MNLVSAWHKLSVADLEARLSPMIIKDILDHMRLEETYAFPQLFTESDRLRDEHQYIRYFLDAGRLPPLDFIKAHEQNEQTLFERYGL